MLKNRKAVAAEGEEMVCATLVKRHDWVERAFGARLDSFDRS